MKTEKLQKLKELLLQAYDLYDQLSDEELDIIADSKSVSTTELQDHTITNTYDEEDLLGFLIFKREVIQKFFESVEQHPGFIKSK